MQSQYIAASNLYRRYIPVRRQASIYLLKEAERCALETVSHALRYNYMIEDN